PGITKPGTVCTERVITMDYYPTILEITGIAGNADHNKNVDGVSLVPLLRDPKVSLGRDALYWHYPHYNVFVGIPYSAIRVGDYKLIKYYEDNHTELYNLAMDLSETHDLTATQPDITARLKKQLEEHLHQVGAQLPVPNPQYKTLK
uniref:sulfatase/phosphatase domain-containing protein n=1 Tax=uncultured Gimesia sp. TaxID=1678688 RepID=UPI00260477C2